MRGEKETTPFSLLVFLQRAFPSPFCRSLCFTFISCFSHVHTPCGLFSPLLIVPLLTYYFFVPVPLFLHLLSPKAFRPLSNITVFVPKKKKKKTTEASPPQPIVPANFFLSSPLRANGHSLKPYDKKHPTVYYPYHHQASLFPFLRPLLTAAVKHNPLTVCVCEWISKKRRTEVEFAFDRCGVSPRFTCPQQRS